MNSSAFNTILGFDQNDLRAVLAYQVEAHPEVPELRTRPLSVVAERLVKAGKTPESVRKLIARRAAGEATATTPATSAVEALPFKPAPREGVGQGATAPVPQPEPKAEGGEVKEGEAKRTSPASPSQSGGSKLTHPGTGETVCVAGRTSKTQGKNITGKGDKTKSNRTRQRYEVREKGATKQIRLRLLPAPLEWLGKLTPKKRGEALACLIEGANREIDLEQLIELREQIRRLGINLNQSLALWHGDKTEENDRSLRAQLADVAVFFIAFVGEEKRLK